MSVVEPETIEETTTAADFDEELKKLLKEEEEKIWSCVVLDDDVNTIPGVAKILKKHFHIGDAAALRHTMEIHYNGESTLAKGKLAEMTAHVQALHGYGLNAEVRAVDSGSI